MTACLLLQDVAAAPPQIQVRPLGCADGIHLVANKAAVSDVLDALARVARFRVIGDGRITTPVTVDSVQSTQRLLATILSDENTIVKVEADSVCPGRLRVAEVWIVAKGARSTGAPSPLAPKTAASLVTPEAKAQDDLYRRAHGLPPE